MSNLFVQVETGFPASKLVDKARDQLAVSTDIAIAKLVRLWLATMAVGCHGQIGERSDSWIEEAVAWTGEPGAFAKFVRAHHLDSSGMIREWTDKYGAVEMGREKAKVKKRNQRKALRGEPVVETVPGTDAGPEQGPATPVPGTLIHSPVSQSQETLSKGNIQTEGDLDAHRAKAIAKLDAFAAAHDFGRFQDQVVGYIRASSKPLNVMAHLELWLTGEMGYKQKTGEEIGFALNQYAASGEHGFKSAYFDGFVRRVKVQQERNVGSEQRVVEEQRLVEEKRLSEERAQEERDRDLLADFERRNEQRFEALKQQAAKTVAAKGAPRMTAATRDVLIHDELVKLVRKEVG